VLVASDEKSLGDLMNALPTRDESKVDALVESGHVLRVANDTPVRVLEHGTGKTRIRILQGDHLMAEVWAPERWVK
jgi:translation initiation factor IF-1